MASSGSFNTTAYDGRYLTFAWSQVSQDITNNKTTISWTLKGAGGDSTWYYTRNIKVTIEGETVYSFPQSKGKIQLSKGTLVASGQYTISHNADGSKSFSAYAEAGIYKYAVNCTGSGNFALNTIARASQPSCITWPEHTQNVGNFGTPISIHTNRASSAFTHTVRYAFGSQSGTIATGVTTGTTWTIPLTLMNLIPASTSGSGTIYLDTYNGSTKIGTKWCGFTATVPASVKPSCSLDWEDISGNEDIYGSPVQGLSQIKITVTANTTNSYGSPIESYSISANGKRYTSTPVTTEILTVSGSFPISVTVKDKRGRVGTASSTLNVQAYTPPKITSLSVHRSTNMGVEDEQGEHVKVNFTAAVSSMNKKNTCEYVVKYKKSSETTWTSIPQTIYTNSNYAPTASVVFAADGNSSYDVMVTATDRHGTASRSTSVSTAFTLMNWHPSGTGMAFGKVAEKENAVEFRLDVQGRALGLGTLELVPNSSDLNTYTIPGVYSIATDAAAETMKNMPKAVAGRLVISDSTGTEPAAGALYEYKEQLFLPHDIGRGGMPWVRQIRRAGSTQWTYYPWQSFALFSYPVGSIYIAYNHTSPAELFGGTWVRLENTFLWGVDENGGIGVTGGEKTHTLTINEMPSHTHGSVYSQHATGTKDKAWYTASGSSVAYGTIATGGGQAHNNMPPYTHVSIWRRTA